MKSFYDFFQLIESNQDVNSIVQNFLNSDTGKQYAKADCKTVTRAFVKWAESQNIPTKIIHLAPPDPELVKQGKAPGGRSGTGDAHIMPIIFNKAIDFTVRQFGINRPYNNPLITDLNNVENYYKKFGYFTYAPDWFHNGKSFYIGKFSDQELIPHDFHDENL